MNTKSISLAMVMLSFLAGAFIAVLDPVTVNWGWMSVTLMIGVAGLWTYRRATHSEASSGHRLSGDMQLLQESLQNILSNLQDICGRKEDIPVYEARFEIDRLFRTDLNNFAESREAMIHIFGMQSFADVMSAFAAGERYINRVWSASTDGYIDEVHQYLEKARYQFEEAKNLFSKLQSEKSQADSTASIN
ncbi:MAG: hypothetical protein ACI934_002267 [Pseudohongiellaceae bacterium]|jgi:hypothetical protein